MGTYLRANIETLTLNSPAHGMAISNKRLFVSTVDGTLYCFATTKGSSVEVKKSDLAVSSSFDQAAKEIQAKSQLPNAYCLVLDDLKGDLTSALLRNTPYQLLLMVKNSQEKQAFKEKWISSSYYGSRVAVKEASELEGLKGYAFFA